YVAVSTLEASLDVESRASSSTKVFILEVMGRHAGWIAAAAGLVAREEGDPPHVILFPEVPFKQREFLKKVRHAVEAYGYCTVVVSEGVKDGRGRFLADAGTRDAFGHAQLGGVAPVVANLVREKLGYKYHWAVSDYLQRSARHIASKTDVEQAYAVGEAAVKLALEGKSGVMPVIRRTSNQPYRWEIGETSLGRVANVEKKLPKSYISADGFGITPSARRYLSPLIQGEDYPPFDRDGLPRYVRMKKVLAKKKLADFEV
ncbi:MAG: diphosphate--fructose-6-phosphate 1-phosphotransferase, partial [Gammaproteobacteria bacterium]